MKIFKILLSLIIAFTLFSCDAFIAHQKDRENPYDENNPVPAVVNFKATPINENNDVRLSWNTQEGKDLPLYMIIVGKPNSEPTSIDDYVIRLESADFSINELMCEAQGVDTNIGKKWYFSAWTCDESREHFTFCGTDSATFEIVQLEIVAGIDGWVSTESTAPSNFGDTNLKAGLDATFLYVSLLKFRQEDLPEFVTGTAELQLDGHSLVADQDIAVQRILVGWDESSITYDTAAGAGFTDTANFPIVNVSMTSQTYSWDVTNLIAVWAESPESNCGLLIINISGTELVEFDSIESAMNPPTLIISGYN